MTVPKFNDIKNAQIPLTTATFIAVTMFIMSSAFWVGFKQSNMERDIIDNAKSIQGLIEYNQIQDAKLDENQKKLTEYYTAIELIKSTLNTIGNDIKDIKASSKIHN